MIRAIDICCGAGGWACAARGLPIQFVAVADHAADCLETWSLNNGAAHPDCQLLQVDLSTAKGMRQLVKAASKVDLVVGGIPCEQVSTARGNQPLKNGEMATLHSLVDQCFWAVKKMKPRYWCFEDVEAITPHLPPPLFVGLNYEIRKINAADYGPQKRQRVFIGCYPPLAVAEPGPRVLGDVLRPGPYRTLPNLKKYQRSKSKWYGAGLMRVNDSEEPGPTVLGTFDGNGAHNSRAAMVPLARVQNAGEACPTITQMAAKGDRSCLVGAQSRNLDASKAAPTVTESFYCDERTVPLPPSIQDRPQSADAPSPAVVAGHGDRCWPIGMEDGLVRVMEWQEAAALQGFPNDYIFAASWSRTWKLVAQAIPIQVGRAILKGIVVKETEA